MNRLYSYNKNNLVYQILLKQKISNIFLLPKIEHIYLNIGVKNSHLNKKLLIPALSILELISLQKPMLTLSRKDKLTLKIKKGLPIGCKTVLNKKMSYIFFEKLTTFIFPNQNNFIGMPAAPIFNQRLSFTIKNYLDFPELSTEFLKFKNIPPLDVTIHTNSKTNSELNILLSGLSFPFNTNKKSVKVTQR